MSLREQKLRNLTSAGRYDVCSPGECMQYLTEAPCITYAPRRGGCGRMLRVLMHGDCAYDCAYCPIRVAREGFSFTPAELAETFLRLHREGMADGLFLSSGIARDVDTVMHDIVETGERLRRAGYAGYLHLKVLPGAARSDIRDAARVADRISINIEAPSADRLGSVAGVKDYRIDIKKRQDWVAEAMPDRHTTQLVVGVADETDREIFACVQEQYRRVRPTRIYYSAFRALAGTPLADQPDTPAWRAHRWYQLDHLLREYRIDPGELDRIFDAAGSLANRDPKVILAEGMGVVDVNTASRYDLLRVPGIGPAGADRILRERKTRHFESLRDLKAIGIRTRWAAGYLAFPRERTVQTLLPV
ncbi:radical SAM protein [Methanoculleus sp. FWC-SCC1]|uniref:Radical SAM protein n=1 Tax=Methanoculleus frigidifontis TaxID=2584085 RepID=A0ABT8MDM6_9EURY|nr:helix-hairpin-helix domain-containing protein [Methanoculleus sp. FWC-SCC1]MDN7026044.1 radical SAM protein [Methanoculleus sp. FWC-SCC1]